MNSSKHDKRRLTWSPKRRRRQRTRERRAMRWGRCGKIRRSTLAAIAGALGMAGPSEAVMTVFDPTVNLQQIISTAQEVAKFVEMIDKQVEQIRQLEEQVSTLHHYVDLFGDPSSVAPQSVAAMGADLVKVEVGAGLEAVTAAANPLAAMAYDGGGVFSAIGEEFQTPAGARIQRVENTYRGVAVIQGLTENFVAVSGDTSRRRVSLKGEIARTTAALAKATSDAEVQKLTGVLVGLVAALEGTEQELAGASAAAIVQDIASRADSERQWKALAEEAHAEFAEATGQLERTFGLVHRAVAFPVE